MKHKTHLAWIIGLVLIALLICGTIIYLNNNAWTVRLEMDNNTRASIESIQWEEFSEVGKENTCLPKGDWHSNTYYNWTDWNCSGVEC